MLATSSCSPSSSSTTSPGVVTAEPSSAGTTGLLDLAERDVVGRPRRHDRDCSSLGVRHPAAGGYAGRELARIPVHLVGGHDTASAVLAGAQHDAPFVATGTWRWSGASRTSPTRRPRHRGRARQRARCARRRPPAAQRRRVVAGRGVPAPVGDPDLDDLLARRRVDHVGARRRCTSTRRSSPRPTWPRPSPFSPGSPIRRTAARSRVAPSESIGCVGCPGNRVDFPVSTAVARCGSSAAAPVRRCCSTWLGSSDGETGPGRSDRGHRGRQRAGPKRSPSRCTRRSTTHVRHSSLAHRAASRRRNPVNVAR